MKIRCSPTIFEGFSRDPGLLYLSSSSKNHTGRASLGSKVYPDAPNAAERTVWRAIVGRVQQVHPVDRF